MLNDLYKQREEIEDKIRSVVEHGILPYEWAVELGRVSSEIRLIENFKMVVSA